MIRDQPLLSSAANVRTTLASCARAIALAKPGPIELHTSCSWRRIIDKDGKPWLWPSVDRDGHPNMDGEAEAEAVVASYNLVSEHHDEIQAMVEDASLWSALCDAIQAGEDLSGLFQSPGFDVIALELHLAERASGKLNTPSCQDST